MILKQTMNAKGLDKGKKTWTREFLFRDHTKVKMTTVRMW